MFEPDNWSKLALLLGAVIEDSNPNVIGPFTVILSRITTVFIHTSFNCNVLSLSFVIFKVLISLSVVKELLLTRNCISPDNVKNVRGVKILHSISPPRTVSTTDRVP